MGPRLYVGVTDYGWYTHLRALAPDEANFWQPSAHRRFLALAPGDMFLFKLHAPYKAIVGGGFFARYTTLPLDLAWETFGAKNGVNSAEQMAHRVQRYVQGLRGAAPAQLSTHEIGCILLQQPFFLPERDWIDQPEDWSRNIVQGRSYDLAEEAGAQLFGAVRKRIAGDTTVWPLVEEPRERYGAETVVRHRLGQGSFRASVVDAYNRRCAITGDRVLWVLDAAHIRPFARGGEHAVPNGLLLRSDLHTLLDRGYLTLEQDYSLRVSRRIRDEFANGEEYFVMDRRRIQLPRDPVDRPDPRALEWHRDEVFERRIA